MPSMGIMNPIMDLLDYQDCEPKKMSLVFDYMGITVLEDSVVVVDNAISIIGRKDTSVVIRAPLCDLVKAVPDSLPILLLDHNPNAMQVAQQCGVDVQLSGHTHNGQIFPLNFWIFLKAHIKDGMCYGYKKAGSTHYYVSAGLGGSGVPIRIGTTGEIVVLTLY